MKNNPVGWFEIPVTDMDRAAKFYETVFDVELTRTTVGQDEMAWFPWDEKAKGATGSLVKTEGHEPCHKGIRIYFTSPDASTELGRVESAGGKVVKPKTIITPEIGYCGEFRDTEGNQVAIHSRQ